MDISRLIGENTWWQILVSFEPSSHLRRAVVGAVLLGHGSDLVSVIPFG